MSLKIGTIKLYNFEVNNAIYISPMQHVIYFSCKTLVSISTIHGVLGQISGEK